MKIYKIISSMRIKFVRVNLNNKNNYYMKLLIKFKTQKHLNKLKKHNKLIVKVHKRIISTIFN
jgi:hypothetical protein